MIIQCIEERKLGHYTKSQSWFHNEGVQLAIHKYISFFKDKLLAQKLAKAVSYYLSSQIITNNIQKIFWKRLDFKKKQYQTATFWSLN